MYLQSSSISFFLFPCWVWEDIYQSRPLRSCASWIHQHNMISGKQRRGRAGRVERFQWYSTKLRQFLMGTMMIHQRMWSIHMNLFQIFMDNERQIVAVEFWFTKFWQFQRWRSGRKGVQFGASKSQDGSICKPSQVGGLIHVRFRMIQNDWTLHYNMLPCVTLHCSTFHHVSSYFNIWHDILLHCTVYSIYVCM